MVRSDGIVGAVSATDSTSDFSGAHSSPGRLTRMVVRYPEQLTTMFLFCDLI